MRLPSFLVLTLASSVCLPSPLAGAQEPAQPAAASSGARGRRPRAPSVIASFPGFHLNADGTSRCFVHVSQAIAATPQASRRRFEVLLPGARVSQRNDLNVLETRFFNTPMARARLERRGRTGLVLVVELRADVTPTMRTETDPNGGVIVVVELPAGRFVEGPPQLGGEIRYSDEGEEPDRAAGSSGLGADEERARTGGSVRPAASTASTTTPTAPSASEPSPTTQSRPPARTATPDERAGDDDERPPSFGGR